MPSVSTTRLRRRIFAALLLADATGCDAPSAPPSGSGSAGAPTPVIGGVPPAPVDKTSGERPEPVPKTTMDPDRVEPKPEPTPTPDPEPKPTPEPELPDALQNMPTCPNGMWCGIVRPPATGPDSVLGCPPGVTAAVAPMSKDPDDRPGGASISFDAEHTKRMRAGGTNDACCYHWVDPCPGGRPLRDGARVIEADFAAVMTSKVLPPRAPHPAAAAAWLRDAAFEYASVASFARASIELLAVGAPAELLADCQRAALDEIRHAQACAELAWSLGAARRGPSRVAPVAPRHPDLRRLAVDTFIEGCVGETVAAVALRTAVEACDDAEMVRVVAAIAEDEERHAALAWRTLGWALEQGGTEVRSAVSAAAAAARPASSRPAARDPSLAPCGRLDPAATAEVERRAWREVIEPVLAWLLHHRVDGRAPSA